MQSILIWVGVSVFLALFFAAMMILLIIISKKTHAIIEFKSSLKGNPIALFFQDNRYCEWKNTKPDAGMIEDDTYGSFVLDSTYIDKKTKNVLIPFNSSYAFSISVKDAKMADDLVYMYNEERLRRQLKYKVISGKISENTYVKTLRTSVNFSTLKGFVSPILPHNVQSKVALTVKKRLGNTKLTNVPNIVLLVISALSAVILGGLVLKSMLG